MRPALLYLNRLFWVQESFTQRKQRSKGAKTILCVFLKHLASLR